MPEGEILGGSPSMKALRRGIGRVAPVLDSVIVTGETGVGKELVARAIHYHDKSRTREGPLVDFNCPAMPDELTESELFGYKKGAFTGAHADRKGVIESAHNGTLFLDEVGHLSLAAQAKLLRTLQERRVTPVGGTSPVDAREVEFRILAATNYDLAERVAKGLFRNDLLYRLDVHRIHVPPLRDRREDIPELVDAFAVRHATRNRYEPVQFGENVKRRMEQRDWPWEGNVRELESVVFRMCVTALDEGREPAVGDVDRSLRAWEKVPHRPPGRLREGPTATGRRLRVDVRGPVDAIENTGARTPAGAVDELRETGHEYGFRSWLQTGHFESIVAYMKETGREFGDVVDEFAMALIGEAEDRPERARGLLGLSTDRLREYRRKNGVMHKRLHTSGGT